MNYLQKTKDSLVKAHNNLRLANNKAQDVTTKKLTYNNPKMQARFREARSLPDEIAFAGIFELNYRTVRVKRSKCQRVG